MLSELHAISFFPHISFEIFREFPEPAGLKELAAVATKGVAMRFAGLFPDEYTFLSHGEAISSVASGCRGKPTYDARL